MIIMMIMTITMRRDCTMLRGGRSRFLCAVGGDGGILARTQPKNTEYTQNIHRIYTKFYEEQLATNIIIIIIIIITIVFGNVDK